MRIVEERFKLIQAKGVYPYEYITDFNRFNETCLPPIECFHSTLSQTGISTEQYEFTKRVWSTFNMKTLEDYHDLYMLTDVILLADVFETFRKTCIRHYSLDPAHSYTAP